jgi:hypothetical protein
MPAEGALRAAATSFALHAAVVLDARLEGAEQFAVAGLELVQRELDDGARGRNRLATPQCIDEGGVGCGDARRTGARHDVTRRACALRPRSAERQAGRAGTPGRWEAYGRGQHLPRAAPGSGMRAPEKPARPFGATPRNVARRRRARRRAAATRAAPSQAVIGQPAVKQPAVSQAAVVHAHRPAQRSRRVARDRILGGRF